VKVIRYSSEFQAHWDKHIEKSKNGLFLFKRNYMEYHSDKFIDYSLLIFNDKEKLICVIPANITDNCVYTHAGLTFGGLVYTNELKVQDIIDIFHLVMEFFRANAVERFIYKPVPYIYSNNPAQEDLYALFLLNARLFRRDVSVTIDLEKNVRYGSQRKRSIKKGKKKAVIVEQTTDIIDYWALLNEVLLLQHKVKSVHTESEIKYLINKFPENIKLFVGKDGQGKILAGTLVFEYQNIVHTQYLANSTDGKECGALDVVLDYLIQDRYKTKKFFDFGISNEDNGRYLNNGLISQKEGFGARAVVHDQYEILIND
jgi:hypothetical protein